MIDRYRAGARGKAIGQDKDKDRDGNDIDYPLVNSPKKLWKNHHLQWILPIKNGGSFHSFLGQFTRG